MNRFDILERYGSILDGTQKEKLAEIMNKAPQLSLEEFDQVAKNVSTKLWQEKTQPIIQAPSENILNTDIGVLEEEIIQTPNRNIMSNSSTPLLIAGLGLGVGLGTLIGAKVYNYFSKPDEEEEK